MNLFKRLFVKNNSEKNNKSLKDRNAEISELLKLNSLPENTPELFDQEVLESLYRYYSDPSLKIHLNLKGEDGIVYKPHEAFNATFELWSNIELVWDRRTVLFEHWDQTEFDKLQKWQIIERLVKDRKATDALTYKKANISNEDLMDIRLIVALSKLYRCLDALEWAKYYIEGGFKLRPDLDIVKIEYATVLHLSKAEDDHQLSKQIFSEIIDEKIKKTTGEKIYLLDYFKFEIGYIDSSIFALLNLKLGNCKTDLWDKIAGEFYYCPVFRYEHAVFLNNTGDTFRSLAKMLSLTDEFPWYKTGVIANIDFIQQLRLQKDDSSFMKEELEKLELCKTLWTA